MIHTGVSFIDYWSISHLAFWIVVGSTCSALGVKRGFVIPACLSIALSWEVFEAAAETWWPQVWESPESLLNKASDMLTVLVGLGIAFWGFDRWRT